MARFEINGLDDVIKQIEKAGERVVPICKMSVYEGAGIVADAVREELQKALSGESTGDLEASLGIQEIQDTGSRVETAVGFAGYDRKGVPNPLKARVINSGRSDTAHKKTRFISKAIRRASGPASAKMSEVAREELTKELGG